MDEGTAKVIERVQEASRAGSPGAARGLTTERRRTTTIFTAGTGEGHRLVAAARAGRATSATLFADLTPEETLRFVYRHRHPDGSEREEDQPDDVYQAVKAAFEAGAHGVILSRKCSEMRLDNLRAAGGAVRELGVV